MTSVARHSSPPQGGAGGGETAACALQTACERVNAHWPYGTVGVGLEERESKWLTQRDLVDPSCRERLVDRVAGMHAEDTQRSVSGNFLYQYVMLAPLRLAGFLFAAQRRIPALDGNFAWLDEEWLKDGRLLESELYVIEGDPLESEERARVVPDLESLTDRLFEEIDRAFSPFIASLAEQRYVAKANAHAGILDGLTFGVTIAGNDGLGADEAWTRWNTAMERRNFRARRLPKRLRYEVDGQRHEMPVRASCCLYFTTPAAKRAERRYCARCYLISDEQRIDIMSAFKRRQAEEAQSEAGDGDS